MILRASPGRRAGYPFGHWNDPARNRRIFRAMIVLKNTESSKVCAAIAAADVAAIAAADVAAIAAAERLARKASGMTPKGLPLQDKKFNFCID